MTTKIFALSCILLSCFLIGYAIGHADMREDCWQPKFSMKYGTMYECQCDDPVTDACITYCTGDIDPADPLEDEEMYNYAI